MGTDEAFAKATIVYGVSVVTSQKTLWPSVLERLENLLEPAKDQVEESHGKEETESTAKKKAKVAKAKVQNRYSFKQGMI